MLSYGIHEILHSKGGLWTDAVSRQRGTGCKFFLTLGNLHTPGHRLIMLRNILIEVPPCPRMCNPDLDGWRTQKDYFSRKGSITLPRNRGRKNEGQSCTLEGQPQFPHKVLTRILKYHPQFECPDHTLHSRIGPRPLARARVDLISRGLSVA